MDSRFFTSGWNRTLGSFSAGDFTEFVGVASRDSSAATTERKRNPFSHCGSDDGLAEGFHNQVVKLKSLWASPRFLS